MGLSPNVFAVIASVVLGVLVLLWNAALKRITGAELMVLIGLVYLAVGLNWHVFGGQARIPPAAGVRLGLITAFVYASSFLLMDRVFGHPQVNMPIATAITAAYPAVTALIAFALLGARFSGPQFLFLALTLIGVVGLSLFTK